MSGGVRGNPMKIIITLEVKRSPKKKSPAQQKPTAQSQSSKTEITITQN
jgi:hypothetical protein